MERSTQPPDDGGRDMSDVVNSRKGPKRKRGRPLGSLGVSKVNAPEAQALYEAGWTLQMLGARYGVTRQRVQQLVRTDVPTRPPTYSRSCQTCGGKFIGVKWSRTCSACQRANTRASKYDQCACGRSKWRRSAHCRQCFSKHVFSWSLAAKLYERGYGLPDLSRALRVTQRSIHLALLKQGVALRSIGEGARVAMATRQKQPIEAAIKRMRARFGFLNDPD